MSFHASLQLLLLVGALLVPAQIFANEEEAEQSDQLTAAEGEEEQNRFLYVVPAKRVPCACINPFRGTHVEYVGDPNITCVHTQMCYVSCRANCPDLRQARSWTRCYSQLACSLNATAVMLAPAPVAPNGGAIPVMPAETISAPAVATTSAPAVKPNSVPAAPKPTPRG